METGRLMLTEETSFQAEKMANPTYDERLIKMDASDTPHFLHEAPPGHIVVVHCFLHAKLSSARKRCSFSPLYHMLR